MDLRLSVRRVGLVVLTATLSLYLGSVIASAACSVATVKRSYGVQGCGFSAGAHYAAVGIETFDGAGNLTGTLNENEGPGVTSITCVGTYTVNADCTGSQSLGAPCNTTPYPLTIVGGGSKVFLLVGGSGNEVVYLLEHIGVNAD